MAGSLLNREKALILADQAVVSGAALLTQLLVARGLGLEGYGRFSAIALVQLFVLSLFQAGVSGMYMVVCPTLTVQKRKLYTAGILACLLPVVLAICSAAVIIYPVCDTQYDLWGYVMITGGIVLALLQDLYRKILLTNGHYGTALIADLLNNGGQLAGIGLLMYTGHVSFVSIVGVCTVSFIPALVYAAIKCGIYPRWRSMKLVYGQHISQAPWLVASALLQWFAGNIYVVAGGWWLGPAALGILRLAQYVFGLFNVLLQAVENYLLPRVSALVPEPDDAIAYLKGVQRKMTLFAGVAILLVAFAAPPALAWLQIALSGDVLVVIYGMSAVYLFVVAGYPVRIALRSLRHSNEFFRGYVINALFGIASAYMFVHQWGVAGIVAGLFVSQLILLTYWAGVLQKKYRAVWK